jgi:hypothetical protein
MGSAAPATRITALKKTSSNLPDDIVPRKRGREQEEEDKVGEKMTKKERSEESMANCNCL